MHHNYNRTCMAHCIFHEVLRLVKFFVCLWFINLHGLHTPGTCKVNDMNFTDITVTKIQTKNILKRLFTAH